MLTQRTAGRSPGDADRLLVEEELARLLGTDPPQVGEPMRQLVEAGGKRLRPVLVMLCSRLGPAYDPGRAAALAASLELIHTASLVHDDYVDESPRRRGRPTVAASEGAARAVAVGDYYFAKATRTIAGLGEPAVTSTVAQAMESICRAQIDDYELRGRFPGDRESYLKVIRGKTAALFSASCVAGAQLAKAGPAVVAALACYGDLVGVAFQMTDDLVDFHEGSGKPLGQDVRERVASLPLIYAAEDARSGDEVRSLLARPLDDGGVQRVVWLARATGALDRVRREAGETSEAAVRTLAEVGEGPVVDELAAIAREASARSA